MNKQDRINHLIEALKRAEAAALQFKDTDDGGTCNFDMPVIKLPRWKPEEIQAVQQATGIVISDKWDFGIWKGYRPVGTSRHGQGNRRTRMAEAAYKSLRTEMPDLDVRMYYAMD